MRSTRRRGLRLSRLHKCALFLVETRARTRHVGPSLPGREARIPHRLSWSQGQAGAPERSGPDGALSSRQKPLLRRLTMVIRRLRSGLAVALVLAPCPLVAHDQVLRRRSSAPSESRGRAATIRGHHSGSPSPKVTLSGRRLELVSSTPDEIVAILPSDLEAGARGAPSLTGWCRRLAPGMSSSAAEPRSIGPQPSEWPGTRCSDPNSPGDNAMKGQTVVGSNG